MDMIAPLHGQIALLIHYRKTAFEKYIIENKLLSIVKFVFLFLITSTNQHTHTQNRPRAEFLQEITLEAPLVETLPQNNLA